MPQYELKCIDCPHGFEVIQGVNDPLPQCPQCGGNTARLISNGSFRLKGSGWTPRHYFTGLK